MAVLVPNQYSLAGVLETAEFRRPAMLRPGVVIAVNGDETRAEILSFVEKGPGWRMRGYASTVEESITVARKLQPDLLFLDLGLPNKREVEAIPEILDVCPFVRIIALAADHPDEQAAKALTAGASGMAMKSDAMKDLSMVSEEVVRGRASLSPAAERCVRRYVHKEMKILTRKRDSLNAAIAEFERLEMMQRK
jgi:DNA-binding NarL/FixJ family response regulator